MQHFLIDKQKLLMYYLKYQYISMMYCIRAIKKNRTFLDCFGSQSLTRRIAALFLYGKQGGFFLLETKNMNEKKAKVLDLIDKTLSESLDGYRGMTINTMHSVNGNIYDSVDIYQGSNVLNVRIAGDSPLAIFKDIARAIQY